MPFHNPALSPTVSIVLATHNGAPFLAELLESLAAQTVKPCEIVISDDASTDTTWEILTHFSQHSSIPVLLLQNNPALGYRENFLSAAGRATGDLIAFCDQDDVWLPAKLEACLPSFSSPNTVLVVHQATLISQSGEVLGSFDQEISATSLCPPLSLDPWGIFFGFSVVFRRSLLDAIPAAIRGVDYIIGHGGLAHDRWVYFLANILGDVVLLSERLVRYRQHGQNLFGADGKTNPSRLSIEHVVERSKLYIAAAAHAVAMLEALPDSLPGFPGFNKQAAVQLWVDLLNQQLARNKLYTAASRLLAARQLLSNLIAGTYRSPHDRRWRPRGLALDALYFLRHTYTPQPQMAKV